MQAPLMYVGLWDPRRTGKELLTAARVHLQAAGAELQWGSANRAVTSGWPDITPDGEAVEIEVWDADQGVGGLIQIVLSIEHIDFAPDEEWEPLEHAVVDLVIAVRPMVAVGGVEIAVILPDCGPDYHDLGFSTGWVDIERCSPRQRAAFDAARGRGICNPVGPGLAWGGWDPDLVDSLSDEEWAAREDAIYEAWTGRTVPPRKPKPPAPAPAPAPDREPLVVADLCFWRGTDSLDDFEPRVSTAVTPRELEVSRAYDDYAGPFGVVVATHPPHSRTVAALLDDLRAVVGTVRPLWASVEPNGLAGSPGVSGGDSEPLTHPWVDRDWIGSDLPRLEEALAGCHREEVGGGVLWITDPDLAPQTTFSAEWYDRDRRWQRRFAAGAVVGEVVRSSTGYVEQPPGKAEHLALWDHRRAGAALYRAVQDELRRQGARIIEDGAESAYTDFPPLSVSGYPTRIELLRSDNGTDALVDVVVWLDLIGLGSEPLHAMSDAMFALVDEVRPALAVLTDDDPRPLPWPDPPVDLLAAGWVDLDACSEAQRSAFTRIRDHGMAADRGPGVYWDDTGLLVPVHREVGYPYYAIRRAAHEAWTGRWQPGHEPGELPDPEPPRVPPPELWLWPASEQASSALTARGWEPTTLFADDGDHWATACVRDDRHWSVPTLLDDLRAAAGTAKWAAVQPRGDFYPPGLVDGAGIVVHPWVHRDWIGEGLDALDDALAGCHREEVAGGILWITDPAFAPQSPFVADWTDPERRFRRLQTATGVIGAAMRAAWTGRQVSPPP